MKRVSLVLSIVIFLSLCNSKLICAKTLVAVDKTKPVVEIKYKSEANKTIWFATLPNTKLRGKSFKIKLNKSCYVAKNNNPKQVSLIEDDNYIKVKYKKNIKKPIKCKLGYGLNKMNITVKNTHGVG